MSDLIREIDEELRQERMMEVLNRWQPAIIGVAIAALAAIGGYNYYQKHEQQLREQAGVRYQVGLDQAKLAGVDPAKAQAAEAALTGVAKDAPAGYKALALLRAAALSGAVNAAAGVKDFDALTHNPALPPLYQNLASLRAALLRLDHADLKEMHQRLDALSRPGAPFRNFARELLAIAALKAGDLKSAGEALEAIIIDPQADPTMRARAEQLSALIRSGPLPSTGAASNGQISPAPATVAPFPK